MKRRFAAVLLTATAVTAVSTVPASAHSARHHKTHHHASCNGLTIALVTKTICIPL